MALAGGFEFDEAQIGHVVGPNITPIRKLASASGTEAEIVTALRDGKRPDGTIIGPPMPIPVYQKLSDQDVAAMAAYLRGLKPVRHAVARTSYFMSRAYQGGRELPDFGKPGAETVSRNITAGTERGVGDWSDGQIKRAITIGIRADGRKLGRTMPFDCQDHTCRCRRDRCPSPITAAHEDALI